MPNYKVKINADLFTSVNADNEQDARNLVIKKIDEFRKYVDEVDTNEMSIVESK